MTLEMGFRPDEPMHFVRTKPALGTDQLGLFVRTKMGPSSGRKHLRLHPHRKVGSYAGSRRASTDFAKMNFVRTKMNLRPVEDGF